MSGLISRLAQRLSALSVTNRRRFAALAVGVLCASLVTAARSELHSGGSAVQARREATQSIPWSKLTPAATERLRGVLDSSSIVRRLPAETIQCDPDLYLFLVRHPEVVVNIWRHMGITRCSLKRTQPFVMEASDGAGTKSRVELIYGASDIHVMLAEGEYTGRLTRQPIRGRCLLLLRTHTEPAANGKATETKITSQMDVFLTLDHKAAEVIAKALHPMVGKTVDQNFRQTVQFVGQIAQVARRNSDGMQRLALQLDTLDRNVRDEFAILTARVGERPPRASRTSQTTMQND